MGTPSEEVSAKVVHSLKEKGLLLSEDCDKLKAKIVSGTIKAEDWFLAAEKAVIKGANQ
jgi:hypothetical protein